MIADCIKFSALSNKFSQLERCLPARANTIVPKRASQVAEGSRDGNRPCRIGMQAERIQMRLWVLLNMETPEKKPASSTAKRPRVTESAVTSLQRGRGLALTFWTSSKTPRFPLLLNSDHPAPSAH